jgi:hypothetical protein
MKKVCLFMASIGLTQSAFAVASQKDVTARILNDGKTIVIEGQSVQGQSVELSALDFKATATNHLNDGFTFGKALLSGRFFSASAVNPRTGKVALGVYADYKVLISWSFVFIYDPLTGNKTLLQLPVKGKMPNPGETEAYDTVSSVSFDSLGRLHVIENTPSDQETEFVFNPDLSLYKCTSLDGGTAEGANRCPNE